MANRGTIDDRNPIRKFSIDPLCEAAPRPSLYRGVRQFVWNRLESVSCHFAEQLQPLSTKHSRVVTRQFSKKNTSTSRPPERSGLGAYQLCLQNQWDNSASTDSPRQRIREKSRYGNSVSTLHHRYGHRLRTPFFADPISETPIEGSKTNGKTKPLGEELAGPEKLGSAPKVLQNLWGSAEMFFNQLFTM